MKKKIFISILSLVLISLSLVSFYLWFERKEEKEAIQKFSLAKNFLKEKNWEKAANIFEDIYKNYPRSKKNLEAMFNYARALEKLKRGEEAYSLFRKIIADYPESEFISPSMIILAQAELDEGKLAEAQEIYEKVVRDFPDTSSIEEAWLGLGQVYEKKGELAEAKSFYKRVINEFPQGSSFFPAREKLGNLEIKMIFSSYPSVGSFVYKVGQGDTLESIAKRFNTTTELLKEANKLKSSRLSIGRRLKVTPCNFNIFVDKSKNILILKYNEEVIKIYSVATGKHNSTPVGDFKITNKLKNPDWYRNGRRIPSGNPENILGTRWMGISEASYGIHGTTQPETIGTQSTEGCVRMLNKDVEELYKLVTLSTPVKIID